MQSILENFKNIQMMQQGQNQLDILSQGGDAINKIMKQRAPNDPALSIKDSSILSSEDSIQMRRRLRENLEREFGMDYQKHYRGSEGRSNYGAE